MFSYLKDSEKVKLFQTAGACTIFEQITVIYETFTLSKE